MNKYTGKQTLEGSTRSLYNDIDDCITDLLKARVSKDTEAEGKALFKMESLMVATLQQLSCVLDFLQQEQPDEQPEYGHLSTEYVHGRKPRWSVGDVLAYYICTSNEEGERVVGKIINVEFDDEEGWIYTFEDEGASDEQSLIEEGVYKIIENGK